MAKKSAAKNTGGQKSTSKKTAEAKAEAVVAPALPRVHPLVVAFVVYHVVAITTYALPKPSDLVLDHKVEPRGSDSLLMLNYNECKQWAIFYGYLYPSGFWQYWDMFAPDPSQVDTWCDAEVKFLDGTKTTFQYPRMKDLSIPEKFIRERHRKFYERVNSEKSPYFWPPFAQAIAYQTATDPNSPPVQVTLIRHFQEIMRHDKPQPVEPPYKSYRYFTYVVDQHKLFADKGWKLGIH